MSRPYSASGRLDSDRHRYHHREGDTGRPRSTSRSSPAETVSPSNNTSDLGAKDNTNGNNFLHTFSDEERTLNKQYKTSSDGDLASRDVEESGTQQQSEVASQEGGEEGAPTFLRTDGQTEEETSVVLTDFDQLRVQEDGTDRSNSSSGHTDEADIRTSPPTLPLQRVKTESTSDYERDRAVLEDQMPDVSDISDVNISYTPDKIDVILPSDAGTPRNERGSPLEGAPTFLDLSSPEKGSNSPPDREANDIEDFPSDTLPSQTSDLDLPPHRRLTESMVERLITVPVSGGSDASWKHSKQMYSCPLCAKVCLMIF